MLLRIPERDSRSKLLAFRFADCSNQLTFAYARFRLTVLSVRGNDAKV
jgi:hypothetical protein